MLASFGFFPSLRGWNPVVATSDPELSFVTMDTIGVSFPKLPKNISYEWSQEIFAEI